MTTIIIAGAPGSGKTTISNLLKEKLNGVPLIDFGRLREFHLKPNWSDANDNEEQMAFENLLFILQNYEKYGYKYIIVNDLLDARVQSFPAVFSGDFKIFTLTVDDTILRQRVMDPTRDSGFRDTEAASKWNQSIKDRETIKNEYKIDNSQSDPAKTVKLILADLCPTSKNT